MVTPPEVGLEEIALELGPADKLAAFGPQGVGKTALCRHFFRLYPLDRVVVDPNGDIDPGHEFTRAVPRPLPPIGVREGDDWADNWWESDGPLSLRYVPDYTEANWREELDQLVGLAFLHRQTMFWWDEVQDLIPAGQTTPWTRTVLGRGRHRDMPQLFSGPRFHTIDLQIRLQVRWMIVMGLLELEDLQAIAKVWGIKLDTLIGLLRNLEPHGYLAWHRPTHDIYVCPPLDSPL